MHRLCVLSETATQSGALRTDLAGVFDILFLSFDRIRDQKPEQFTVINMGLRETSHVVEIKQGAGRKMARQFSLADGNPRAFTCRLQKMTPHALEIAAPVRGNIGEWVKVHFDTLGKFEGPIIRIGSRALVMRIVGTAEDRNKVAGKIAWMANKHTADGRRHKRFTPANPDSAVRQSNGAMAPCQIIDYSVSGAGVISDLEPPIGTVIKLGTVFGRVVRKLTGGLKPQS